MSFLKTVAQIAKAIDKAEKQAQKERAKKSKAAAKDEKMTLKMALEGEKRRLKETKASEASNKKLLENMKEELRMVKVPLKVDNDFDWLAEHVL